MAGELEADSRKEFLPRRNEGTGTVGFGPGEICPSCRASPLTGCLPLRLSCHPTWWKREGQATFQNFFILRKCHP